jgi:hypothetical protein
LTSSASAGAAQSARANAANSTSFNMVFISVFPFAD